MAETNATDISAEERQKRIDEKTSVGVYAVKQVQQTVIPLIGGAVGWLVAAGLLKNARLAEWAERSMPFKEARRLVSGKHIFSGISASVGMIISGMFNTYEHWKNVESEKLAVSEINNDIGNLVEQRRAFADTLTRQEAVIKDIIAQREDRNFSDRAAAPETGAAEATR